MLTLSFARCHFTMETTWEAGIGDASQSELRRNSPFFDQRRVTE